MNKEHIQQLTDNVFTETQTIIDKFGPRLAGTKSSLDTANYLFEHYKEFADDMKTEDFYIHKGAFFGWIKILVINYLLSVLAIFLKFYWVGILLSTTSILILYFQFIRYYAVIDFLFPKKRARNVYGIIEPSDEVRRQIIVSGHHDSAPIFNFFVHQPKLYALRINGGIGLVILTFVASIILTIYAPNLLHYALFGVLALGFLLVGQMWFFANKKATPGAGDNLVSTMIAFEIGKYFYELKKANKGLKHTRLIFLSFDAEEEGLRGARAFVKNNKAMLEETPTYLLNADCIYDEKELFFLTSDINNTVKLSKPLANELIEVSKNLDIKTYAQDITVLTGGTDAGEFGKINTHATTLIGMPWTNDNRSHAYHTPKDTLDNVSKQAVYDALNIFTTYIHKKDLDN